MHTLGVYSALPKAGVFRMKRPKGSASVQGSLVVLEKDLAGARGQLSEAEKQVTALERSSQQYKALWMSNKRLNDAARVIQRRYKLWRMGVLRDQSSRDAQVRSSRSHHAPRPQGGGLLEKLGSCL